MAWLAHDHWRRRLAGLALGFLLLAALEGGMRLTGWGRPDPAIDPFVSFQGAMPLFTVDPLTNSYVTAPERLKFFIEDRFPRLKRKETFRIFCLGGSTVQGRPYSIETSFTSWLRLGLEAAYPERRFEVVNCGGVSYASYRLIPILSECLNYEPDLFVVCTGQNEFLERRTYETARRWAPLHALASRLHLYHGLRRLKPQPEGARAVAGEGGGIAARAVLKREVNALLDYRGGLRAYRRDDGFRHGVERHFRTNVGRMIALAAEAEVPILFLRPPVNLADCPPFKSEAANAEAAALVEEASRHYRNDIPRAINLLVQAVALDPRCARAHFELGQCLMRKARFAEARSAFWRAVDEDLCQLRMLSAMASDLREICQEADVPCLDLQILLERDCLGGVAGNEMLVDHVHPSIKGHQKIARAVQEYLETGALLGVPTAAPGWEAEREERFRKHLDGLDRLYYTHGDLRLRNLRLWTQGRADGPDYREPPAGKGPVVP